MSEADERYIKAMYAEGIRRVDSEIEQFFDLLKTAGIYDRALIIVWSDHGEGLYDHEIWRHGEVLTFPGS